MTPTERFEELSVKAATLRLGFKTDQYTHLLLRSGAIRGRKLMGRWFVDPESVELYLVNRRMCRSGGEAGDAK